jgi:hypothetical protein
MHLVAMPVMKNGYAVPDLASLTALPKLTKVKKFNNYGKHFGKASAIHDAQCAGTPRQPAMPAPGLWDLLTEIGNGFN